MNYSSVLLVILAAAVFSLPCLWKIFEKDGYEGWKCLIPFYNVHCIFEMLWGSGWITLLGFIPALLSGLIFITLVGMESRAFGKGAGFAAGLVLLPIVSMPLLGFVYAVYKGIWEDGQELIGEGREKP